MKIQSALKHAYDEWADEERKKGNPSEPPWMPEGQEQQWELIQSPLFQKKLREIRKRRGIKVSDAKKIYRSAFADGKAIPGTGDSKAWLKYTDKITPEDLAELQNTAINFPSPGDSALKHILLLNETLHIPFSGCSVRIDESQRIMRLVIDISKLTSIGDISKYWPTVKSCQKLLSACFYRSKELAIDTTAPAKIMIVIGPKTTRDQVKKLWPKIKELQKAFSGRSRFRVKENFGRDKIAVEKKRAGKSSVQIQQEMPKMLRGKPFNSPEAVRQADYRHRLKNRPK